MKKTDWIDAVIWVVLFAFFLWLSQAVQAQPTNNNKYCKVNDAYQLNYMTWNDVVYSYELMATYGAVNYFGDGMTESQRDWLSTFGVAVTLTTFVVLEYNNIDLGIVSKNKWIGRLIIIGGFIIATQI